ncbi:radical SAM domain-containing protein [Streptomyces sp. AA4]|nr:radical SAM domain-containing protein [Streptomyces sp. AA4]
MRTSFLWLEVTGRCQLSCRQCYAESGPSGTHGSMTRMDWMRVLDEAGALGVETVQFIGGEPTLYPHLVPLVEHALDLGFGVEVFSNLVHVTDELWDVFSRPGVSLATSYYSDDPAQHAAVTGRPSYARTKANFAKALGRGIPLRAGVIDLGGGQRAGAAQRELVELGVPSVGYDRVRQVGRGVRDQQAGVEQLCGHCGDGVAAISPDGAVWPCVFSRWLPVGNVLDDALAAILAGSEAEQVRTELAGAFAARQSRGGAGTSGLDSCHPSCAPDPCQPTCAPRCSPSCSPCAPFRRCWPTYR